MYKQITFLWRENMLGYLTGDIICSESKQFSQSVASGKNESFEEQIMSKDKYPITFSWQMETTVFIILQRFFVTYAVLNVGEYH